MVVERYVCEGCRKVFEVRLDAICCEGNHIREYTNRITTGGKPLTNKAVGKKL